MSITELMRRYPRAAERARRVVVRLRGTRASSAAQALLGRGSTPGVLEGYAPEAWREHRFGLSQERWAALRTCIFWVTGAGTGFGLAIAGALAAAGARVVLSGRRRAVLEAARDRIVTGFDVARSSCLVVPVDLVDPAAIEAACVQVRRECDGLHGLVHCAALPRRSGCATPLRDDPVEVWDRMLETNVRAPWLLTRGIFPHMARTGQARVIFFSSAAGWSSEPAFGTYNVSKAALNGLGHSMAREYASSYPDVDVQMNVLSPGEARSEMNPSSPASPYAAVGMSLLLLSHPRGGPNGRFFLRDGRHVAFGTTPPYPRSLR